MPALRSPALTLALLGASLGACFTDNGAPALSTGPGEVDASMDPTTVAPGSTSSSTTTATGEATTGETTTGEATTTTTTTTAAATSTGCVPVEWFFDIDLDGYGGPMSTEKCESPGPNYYPESLDCDDANPKINPDADEVCDTVDNDCDGGIDEYPASEMDACNGCKATLGPNSTYYVCPAPERTWDDARARCKTLLGDLVSINDVQESAFIIDLIAGVGLRWWIGLSDGASEDQFVWVDGTPLEPKLATWSTGEPDNADTDVVGPANCVTIGTFVAGWRDESCMDNHAFVCEAPLPI